MPFESWSLGTISRNSLLSAPKELNVSTSSVGRASSMTRNMIDGVTLSALSERGVSIDRSVSRRDLPQRFSADVIAKFWRYRRGVIDEGVDDPESDRISAARWDCNAT